MWAWNMDGEAPCVGEGKRGRESCANCKILMESYPACRYSYIV